MEQAVCLVQTVIVRRFGLGQGRVGVGPAADESPLLRRAAGREITRMRVRGAPKRAQSGFSLRELPGRMVRSMISRSSTS